MNRLSKKILVVSLLLVVTALAVRAQCPTNAPTVIEVCNDAGGNATIRAYFYNGAPALSYFLFSLTTGQYVSDPLGPVTVNTSIPVPPGAVDGVEFGGVPDGDYVIRVNCSPSGNVNIGGAGFNVNSANAINVPIVVDPDCNPLSGVGNADGSIDIFISGGDAPYDITWPTAVTPIASKINAAAGNHSFPDLDGGLYQVVVTDDNGCQFTADINIPITTMPDAGPDQTVCGPSANLSANAAGAGEVGEWTGPAGVTFSPNANASNAVAGNLPVGASTLTWTITDTNGFCPGLADDVIITSDAPATADAGPDQAVCAGSTVTLSGVIGGSATSATWSGGGGSFAPGNTALNAVYTPSAAEVTAGSVTLTLTTDEPAGPCAAATDNIIITINPPASANAGPDQTICADGTVTLSGSFGGAALSATWTGGAGTFTPNNSTMNAVYTPSAAEVAAGTVTLTLTTDDPDGAGPCVAASDDVIIAINALATADAGPDQTICADGTVTLAGSIGGSAVSASWSGGAGTFAPDVNTLNAVYTPDAAEIAAGTVTLTLTTTGPCAAVADAIIITINPLPTVNAGVDQTICAGSTVTLSGAVGGAATGGSWTGGTGTFAPDANTLNAVYTPSAAEITAGTLTLTLTTNDPDAAGPCVAVSDDVVITINAVPTADAGADQTICADGSMILNGTIGGSATSATWSGGGGTFNPGTTTLNATYTPSAAEIAAGTVTLTLTTDDPDGAGPCSAVPDDVTITINALATVSAGADQVICEDGSASLNGVVGGGATSATWSGGAGTFFPDNTDLNAAYTPTAAEIAAGSVTLTLTTNDPDAAGPCSAVSDNVTISINPLNTADAGPDQSICPDASVTLSGAIGGSSVDGTWSGGTGIFAPDNTTLNAVYTPSAAEIAAGTVTLTLTATGWCAPVTDNVVITIDQPSTADAGPDQAICSGSTATLNGSVSGSALSGTWSGGAGTFAPDNTTLNAVYTPTAAEIAAGIVTLTLTTTGPCTAVADNVTITIVGPATSDAGADQSICAGSSVTLNGNVGGSAVSGIWSGGAGAFSPDNTTLNAVYTPTAGEVAAGTLTLTLTTAGPCAPVGDNVTITIEPAPTADAGSDQTICSAGTATLSGSSVGGSASTGAWSIMSGPSGGDGLLSDISQTASPSAVTFTATVEGTYTLRLTTDDPAGQCNPVTDDVVITVTAGATASAGADQMICVGGSATLAGGFTGSTGITWTTSGDGSFNDASLTNAVYTPGPTDVSNGTVTLTITTLGPCAPVDDDVVITIGAAPTVDAGVPQTICASGSVVLNGSFGGSATGLLWTTSGDGSFSDNTDVNATYTPGVNDGINGTVTLTATATGSCAGTSDNVVITVNPAATIDAGSPQTVCFGFVAALNATLGGSAATLTWTTSGDGAFSNINDPAAVYTPGPNDETNGNVTLTATTNNPAGPCPAASDNVVITFTSVAGDETTAGNETWIGYIYDDSADPSAVPARIDFNTLKYRGYVDNADIGNMSASSTYNIATDAFDLNLGVASPFQGPNVCGSYLNDFSVRFKMSKTLSAGVFRFTVGADDGVRLLIDGIDVIPATAFDIQSYTTYTSQPVCLASGIHSFEIQYFDNNGDARLTFDYVEVPPVSATTPLAVCVNSATPILSASSTDPDVVDFNWYKNGTLFFTGANYTPASSELDMTAAASHTFQVTAVYACGETQPEDVIVNVLNAASMVINPQTICESAGIVDLRTLVDEAPPGGTFVFAGHPNITGNDFDPSGLAGSTISIDVDYSIGSCVAPQGTLSLTITNSAVITVPAAVVAACEGSPDIDLTTLVSATPPGGTFTFSGTQVTGNLFDPSGLAGIETITVDYTIGGCSAPTATFDIDVTANATLTANNANACENGASVNLLTLVSGVPAGGVFMFAGTGVSGTAFDPSGLSGTVTINVDYDLNGCTDNGSLQITVLAPGNPLCTGGTCASVVVIPKPEPATCTNSDGRLVMSIKPFTPAINNTGVKITIDGMSSTNLPISRTIFNDSIFNNLPVGQYDYVIEYGDPSCIKTGQFSIDQSGTVGTPIASNISSPLCPGSATGSLTLDVAGETGNILEWSLDGGILDPFKPFTAGGQITGIAAGAPPSYQHVISVRRNISDVCYASVTVVIADAVPDISVTYNITSATCNGNDGAITGIVAAGGNDAPFTYSINGGQSFQSATTFNGLSGGTYTLRVRDAAGCLKDFDVDVTFPGFINSAISKTNANCTNNGNSGAISVIISDPGVYEVALSNDQFNEPVESAYQPYINPSMNFTQLPRGEYFVYIKTDGPGCPTRSAPINIFGVYAISFDLEPDCNNNQLSLAFHNVIGDPAGGPLEIQVSRKLSSDPPEIISTPFPSNGELYLDYDQFIFLKTPAEYEIRIAQMQSEISCNMVSGDVDFIVPEPLVAQRGSVSESYPDIPTGELQIMGFSGGVYPYEVRIELDSAASVSLPFYETNFEEAGVNENQQIEMLYEGVPPGRYQVEVMDSLGCVVNVIARVPLDEDLFIPNVFTPNGDGSNDVFFIRNLPQEPSSNQLMVSNRWGKQVFTSKNYQNDWDGTGAADGIYFYRLQIGEGEALTGWVEIIRGPKP